RVIRAELRLLHPGDPLPRFVRRRERLAAYPLRVAGNRKDREHPVADELEHLAAAADDAGNLAIEIAVQKPDQDVGRKPIGELRESAHVGKPDRRVQLLGVAAMNVAGQDALASRVADVGVEQDRGPAPEREDLDDAGESGDDVHDAVDLIFGEAAGLARRPDREMEVAVGEDDRHQAREKWSIVVMIGAWNETRVRLLSLIGRVTRLVAAGQSKSQEKLGYVSEERPD